MMYYKLCITVWIGPVIPDGSHLNSVLGLTRLRTQGAFNFLDQEDAKGVSA